MHAQPSPDQLWLFECGGINLSALRERRESLKEAGKARGTIDGYADDWKGFSCWCAKTGRAPLPASQETIELYVTWMLTELGRKVTTAERHVSAIAHYHRSAGHDWPARPPFRQILTAVRRGRKEQPKGKAALDPAILRKIALKLDTRTAMGMRDRALLVLGFASSFRGNELGRLRLSDVNFQKQGLALLVRYSKRDQEGKGRFFGIWRGKRPPTDPVRTLREWIRVRGAWEGPLFCRIQTGDTITRESLSADAISQVLKRAVQAAGLNPANFGSHSLRAGAITASAERGRTNQEIKAMSGHKSTRVMEGYIRRARIFSGRNPLQGVL